MKQGSKRKGTGYVFQGNSIYEQWKASALKAPAPPALRPGESRRGNGSSIPKLVAVPKPAKRSAKKAYAVFVDDNFHYMDESERYENGDYDTFKEAVKACQRIIDDCLSGLYEPGMSSKELFDQYVFCGEDPFIRGRKSDFSAWDYAKRRCEALCSNPIDNEDA